MTWIILGILLVLLLASVPVRRALTPRRERELQAKEAFRANRKMVDEDVTVFGEQVAAVTTVLEHGRFARACLLARQDGTALPHRREECYFNPQHGPAMSEVAWAPPGGVERQIAVCAADARRLAGGEAPDIRLVRVGDRYVPWYAAPTERGLLAASIGSVAIGGVPGYVRFEADLHRMRDDIPGGGGGVI